MSMYGYRKVEPYPLERKSALGIVLQWMLEFCQKDKTKIINDLPSFFNLYPEDFCQLYQADLEVLEKRMMVS